MWVSLSGFTPHPGPSRGERGLPQGPRTLVGWREAAGGGTLSLGVSPFPVPRRWWGQDRDPTRGPWLSPLSTRGAWGSKNSCSALTSAPKGAATDPRSRLGTHSGTPLAAPTPLPERLACAPQIQTSHNHPRGGTGVQTTARGEHEENTVPFSTRKGAWRELAVKLGHKSPAAPCTSPAAGDTILGHHVQGPSFLHPTAHVETRDEVTHLPCPSPPHECAHTRSRFLVFSF